MGWNTDENDVDASSDREQSDITKHFRVYDLKHKKSYFTIEDEKDKGPCQPIPSQDARSILLLQDIARQFECVFGPRTTCGGQPIKK